MYIASSLDDALIKAEQHISRTHGQIFIVGGASIYDLAISHPNCKGVFLTEVSGPMKNGDVFFPLEKMRKSMTADSANQFAHDLIKDSVKNLCFDGQSFNEKDYKYEFLFYH